MLGATTLTAGFLLAGLPTASADQVRDGQWANEYFGTAKVQSITKGGDIIVALIDDGVDDSHPDLSGQILPGFDPGGQGRERASGDSHGTSMAADIAAHGHGDGAGVLGLAPGVKILPIYKGGPGGRDAIPEGVKWAVDNGAKVINISQGSRSTNSVMADAVDYALQHDVLIVASTGNDGAAVDYPANVPGVLAVGAVDKNRKIWSDSNYGPEVMLTAPGVDIVSAGGCGGGSYCKSSGTSDATAFVSAAAALVRAKFPKLTAGQVANRLIKSALAPSGTAGGKLPDSHYGYGILRPYEALTMDIPAGSPQGPLAKAAGGTGSGSTAGGSTPDPEASPSTPGLGDPGAAPELSQPSQSVTPLILGAVGGAVVLLVVIIAIVVANSRRRNRAQALVGQPGGPVPYGAPQGWPPAQQQPGTPQYGQQPPPGYPPQPPTSYQNPYQGQ
ncbi:S8 family serine peptidase [Kitasatospora sp. NPDC004615]|uniref:S8 family serine peptidase n=1 Tax=Kitasatospora sp. NPDC004615 TaxID=3364017 RepID=UPI0036B48364